MVRLRSTLWRAIALVALLDASLALVTKTRVAKDLLSAPRADAASTNVVKRPDYRLDPQPGTQPSTREYTLNIARSQGGPDGFGRGVLSVNGVLPGPPIEAYRGDKLVVHVNNQLDQPTTLHWHGLRQSGTPHEDGVPGFSQCPIPAGGSYTYEFSVPDDSGSFWWHSHYEAQYTDGVLGPLIIHSQEDPYLRGRDYDEEILLFGQDWYHEDAENIAKALNTLQGYGSSLFIAPPPQSIVVNGFGRFDCAPSNADSSKPKPIFCNTPQWPVLRIRPGKRYRLRIVMGGSHAQVHVSLDRHKMQMIAADGTPLVSSIRTVMPVHSGQRYDVIFTADQGKSGDLFWLRVTDQTICYAIQDPHASSEMRVIVQYDDNAPLPPAIVEGTDAKLEPKTDAWPDFEIPCVDIDDSFLAPFDKTPVPTQNSPDAVRTFATRFGLLNLFSPNLNSIKPAFFINDVTQSLHPYIPFLREVREGKQPDPLWSTTATWDAAHPVGDLIINNLDPIILAHPFHLHSRSFHIVARGWGTLDVEGWKNMKVNARAPLRDTLVVPGGTYAVLRVVLDTPGVWAFHCHMAWHLAQGFLGAIIVNPTAIKDVPWPGKAQALCDAALAAGIDPNSTILA